MIDDKELKEAVQKLHKEKKGFSQSYDLIVNLKDLDLKKPDEQVEFFATLPHDIGKKTRVCALVGPELYEEAKSVADTAYKQSEFDRIPKKDIRRAVKEHEYFIGQANIMPQIATAFGRILGPHGKMPNPKAGCIVPPKASLQPLIDRLQQLVKVSAKKVPVLQLRVGTQQQSEDEVYENVRSVYDQIIHHLPKEENNVKDVYLKLTMSTPVKLR